MMLGECGWTNLSALFSLLTVFLDNTFCLLDSSRYSVIIYVARQLCTPYLFLICVWIKEDALSLICFVANHAASGALCPDAERAPSWRHYRRCWRGGG